MSDPAGRDIAIFAYGTLQRSDIQQELFGRPLTGTPDRIAGFRLVPEPIEDPATASALGIPHYWTLAPTGDSADEVAGLVYWLAPPELAAADAYEGPGYRRFEVRLASGRQACVWARP